MAKKKEKFFHPESHTGWRHTFSAEKRRRLLYASTDKHMNKHDRLVQAARKIGMLCNITKKRRGYESTAKPACADAAHFYKRARQHPE